MDDSHSRRPGPAAEPIPDSGGLSRRTRGALVTGEAVVAAVAGGLALGGAAGYTIAAVAVGLVPVLLWLRRFASTRWGSPVPGVSRELGVVGVESRSSGDVGVVGDGQGFAAGIEIESASGAVVDVDAIAALVAADPSRPSSLQVRVTTYAPPSPRSGAFHRPRGGAAPGFRRVHVLLRLEPAWTADVVARHGGGAQGSRAALVAAVDRLSASLRRRGVSNDVLDSATLTALVAEDTATDLAARTLTLDPIVGADIARVLGLLQSLGMPRSIVSICVLLASSDQWQTFAVAQIAGHDPAQVDAGAQALQADAAVLGPGPASAFPAVLPLGGGPAEPAAVLILARA